MSFIDDIFDAGKDIISGVGDFLGSGSLGGNLAKSALLGYGLRKITQSINKDNTKEDTAVVNPTKPDQGVRLQVDPDPEHKIPVVYGRARLGGIISDAAMSIDNQTMYYCITICEKTGTIWSTNQASSISFQDIYWNDQRLEFNSDGITVAYSVDKNGNVDRSLAGLVQVYCYSGNSTTPVAPAGYTLSTFYNAYNIMPNWSVTDNMSDLIFAVIKVTYNRQKNITALGNIKFDLENTLTNPGDCLYDYMTNNRYGAGIDPQEIYQQ